MATEPNAGDTLTHIWPNGKEIAKLLLFNWYAEHFPIPDLWYEAKVNFTKMCAIWSIIGYLIGLGNRHLMDILREKFIFQKCTEVVFRVIRKNQNNILLYLESFKYDSHIEKHNTITVNLDDALKVVER